MPYRIYWDQQYPDILHSHLTGDIEWDEYNEMIDVVFAEIGTFDTPIYFVLQADAPQPTGNPLPHFRQTISKINSVPSLQLAISVDAGVATFLRVCLDVIVKIYSPNWTNKLPFVKTMDDAMALIDHHRKENLKRV